MRLQWVFSSSSCGRKALTHKKSLRLQSSSCDQPLQIYLIRNLSYHVDEGNKKQRLKFAYLTIKSSSFARFARAFFIFAAILALSTTWNDLFRSCFDVVSP